MSKTTKPKKPKRKTVLDWKHDARVKYPDKDYYWWDQYAVGRSKIEGFEKDFSNYFECGDVVLLLVNVFDRDTRSPAKKQAIADWRLQREVHKNAGL